MANQHVTRVVPDDTIGFYLGLALFSVLVPALFGLAWYLSPRGENEGRPATHTAAPTTAEAPAAEAE